MAIHPINKNEGEFITKDEHLPIEKQRKTIDTYRKKALEIGNFEDWGNIFGDIVMASAIIDRIVHHADIIKIEGDSFRTKNYLNVN